MARHFLDAEPLAEARCEPFRHFSRVDEDDRRPVRFDEARHARVDCLPLLVRAHVLERGCGRLDCEVEGPQVPGIDQRTLAAGADKKPPDLFERFLRGAETDALEWPCQCLEPLERQRQVRASFVTQQGVDLVHDRRLDRAEHRPSRVAREQDVQRFRRRHKDVGWRACHARPLVSRRVACAHEHADLGQRGIERADLADRPDEVLLHVVGEGTERGNIEDARPDPPTG